MVEDLKNYNAGIGIIGRSNPLSSIIYTRPGATKKNGENKTAFSAYWFRKKKKSLHITYCSFFMQKRS
jgi:hypothetical protein